MGNLLSAVVPQSQTDSQSPEMLIPPLCDSFYPLAARNRSMETPYNLLFVKNPALRSLFDDYFEAANHFRIRIISLHLNQFSDFIVNVAGPLDLNSEEGIEGNAEFRLESIILGVADAFLDIYVSDTEPTLLMRSSTYFSDLGLELFCFKPFLMKESDVRNVVGLKYHSPNLLSGAAYTFHRNKGISQTAWAVGMLGALSAGVQYEPKFDSKDGALPKTLANWSFAISYGRELVSDLVPGFKLGLQLANNSQLIASFCQHMVVPRKVLNPFERNEVVGITNYIDVGFEWQTSVNGDKYSNMIRDSTFQVVASCQANKNLLVKGKVGPLSSSLALAFKSWWKPALTFNVSAIRDRTKSGISFGFGFQVDNINVIKEASYMKENPTYAMIPNRLEDIFILSGKYRFLNEECASI